MARGQVVKYQNTEVPTDKTVAAILPLVRRYNASEFQTLFDERGEVSGVRFSIRTAKGEWPVRLVPALGEITRLLRREYPSRDITWVVAQARRVAWRHIHNLTEQLLLAVKLGLKTVPGAFMDSIEVDDPAGGTTTMGELLEQHAQLPGGGQGIRLLPPART